MGETAFTIQKNSSQAKAMSKTMQIPARKTETPKRQLVRLPSPFRLY